MDDLEATIQRLRALDTCSVSDAMDTLGLTGVIEGLAAPIGSEPLVGRVVTVQLGRADDRPAERHLCTAAIEHARPGDIILVDHQRRTDCAGWGGNLSRAAQARGVAATVVVGAVRDVDESHDIGFTVVATAATPVTARARAREIDWGVTLQFGDVRAAVGDVLVADGTGVVVIPSARLPEVVATAEAIASKERLIAAALAEGTPAAEAMGANYEQMLKQD